MRGMGHGFLHAGEFGYDGLFRPAAGQALAQTGAGGAGGASAGALPRSVFRSERAAFPGEVAARAPDRAELHLGEAGVARSRTGAARAQAGESIASGVRGGLCPGCCCTSTALITVVRMSVGMT